MFEHVFVRMDFVIVNVYIKILIVPTDVHQFIELIRDFLILSIGLTVKLITHLLYEQFLRFLLGGR